MKTLLIIIMFFLIPILIIAQNDSIQVNDSAKVKQRARDIVKVEESADRTNVIFPGGEVIVNHFGDTITSITVGRRRFEVVDDNGSTRVRIVLATRDHFKGHWAGFDIGFNNFFSKPFNSDLPDDAMFMDLNSGKSISVGLNMLQYNVGLQKNRHNLGLVTGMGLTINNYRFDSPYILSKDSEGDTYFVTSTRSVKKNKLVTSFLTVPLLIEYQLPTSSDYPIFISGGFYGGFKVGSHTKVVYDDNEGKDKEKSHEDLNINSFKYGTTIRAGYRFIKLYASCDLSRLFQAGQGPDIYPWTVGITLVNF